MSGQRQLPGVLFLYNRPPPFVADASNVRENIAAFKRLSRHPVWLLNTNLGFPPRLAELRFDAILLHYSVFAAGPGRYFLDDGLEEYIDGSEAYKIATFQDEHHWCGKRFGFIDRHRIDCVFTMLEQPCADEVYLRRTKATKVVPNLPGYVGPEVIEAGQRFSKPESERSIDVGYRGRPIPAYMGRGALEKREIGERFAELAEGRGLELDIKVLEEERLYGDSWYEFIADCKATLGVESGVSCFDLDDEVRTEYERLAADGHEPTIEELERGALGRWDWNIPYRTISPRHFESAALRVTQILYEGHYSGVMEPMRHYIPLRKDLSNLDEVLERFRDPELRRELTENAHRDLIASGEYGYERLVSSFDQVLDEAGIEAPTALASPATEIETVHKALRRRPVGRVITYYASGLWFWLSHNHPRAWRVAHVLTRPVVVPVRALMRLVSRS